MFKWHLKAFKINLDHQSKISQLEHQIKFSRVEEDRTEALKKM